ncbi:hypothetical protein TrVE_jg4386 [Triparma verrucosa]|uniref:Uncharacterized protein n=1 Tax=Triparma verrucosa TaxID=1606542 RepID=A0A9W7FDA3_9STRA|nr:hypothetical protein TrVE_jg4386 [Triparma verrucosa]
MDPGGFVCSECKPSGPLVATTKRRKCVVIGIDGCRPDALLLASNTFLAPLLRLKGSGISYTFNSTIAGKLPVSYPSWAETFCGTINHGVENNANQQPPKSRNILSSIKGIGLTTSLHMAGWFGFRNVMGNATSRCDTFKSGGDSSDLAACSDSVDFLKVYGYDKNYDNDDLVTFKGDEELQNDFIQKLNGSEIEDATLLYLYNCDRVGHRDGFGLDNENYLTSCTEIIDVRVSEIFNAVLAREARLGTEEWLIVVCTDHGGTSRLNMTSSEDRFDETDGGNAFGQRDCEGVHGLPGVKQHRNTFLLIRAPKYIDRGGEIIVDEDTDVGVTNIDVCKTMQQWFGIANDGDCGGVARGIGGRRARIEGGCVCCNRKTCVS